MGFAYRGSAHWLMPHPIAGWGDGLTCGAAQIPSPHNRSLRVIFSDGEGWEHVSVSLPNRVPNWHEMCFIKDLFWDAEDCVVQYHPPRSQYVNNHRFCLHLWRPTSASIPVPPAILVGVGVAS